MRISGAAAILAVLMMTGLNVTADATLYRWKDSQGNMVMSDRPPPAGQDYETVSTSSTMVVNTADPLEAQQPVAKEAPSLEVKTEKTEVPSAIHKKNPEYCKSARQNLEVLQRPLIRVIDENGEGKILSPEEHEEERQKALEVVEAHCE